MTPEAGVLLQTIKQRGFMKKLILLLTALLILSGCAGTQVRVLPMDHWDVAKQAVRYGFTGKAEVKLLKIKF